MKKHVGELANRTIVSRALAQVNEIRLALAIGEGKLPRMPKGKVANLHQCVLARALSNGWKADVGETRIALTNKRMTRAGIVVVVESLRKLGYEDAKSRGSYSVQFTPTEEMAELIDRFDSGLLPHLILEDD